MRIVLLAVLSGGLFAAELSPTEYIGYVKYLASEDMRGRETGSPELEKAAAYIRDQFRSMHLKPLSGDSYYQDFEVTTSARLGQQNQVTYTLNRQKKTLKFQQDFVPLNVSSAGKVSGEVVFAGYGITAPEYNYDDYAGLDVKDKIVLVLRHEPQEFDDKSVFEGKVYTAHSQIFAKASNAKIHGAKALLMVNDVAAHPDDGDKLEKFGTTAGPANGGIEFAQVKAEVAANWMESAGKNLAAIEAAIDKDLHPQSFAFPASLAVEVNVDIRREVKTVHNVGAYLPGDTDEYVILGAHYDHLGLGEQFSLAPSLAGTVHPGADDNASGTAGVIELANWFSHEPKHKRGILFLTFAGEELGLLGSSYYVNHPILPLANAVAMINMDMIGRIRDRKIYVGGVGTGTTFAELLKEVGQHHEFQADATERGGYGSSDHTSFTTKQVPVLFFFSGLHADYHKPSDTWDKIDAPDAVQLLDMIADVMDHLTDGTPRPQYVRVVDPENPHGEVASHSSGTVSGYGPDFGSIPDFTEIPNGVRFADIRPGSPAAKAGFKGGDILIEFDGKKIQNLYDFTYALRAEKPGQEVLVKVLRGDQTIEAKVLLTERK
ncbi:MAG TPA: M28 family peptidase [Bryobacteraceae bacterium]|jgi:aminopeptidase YwaD|nr:M28 family peptidase [Bryobacteraceae bacterium]